MNQTNDKTCLGVITARGGSKGVPNKCIRDLNGKPVIEYAIEAASACPYITKTVVTTDSESIREVSIRAGAESPFLRPADLATDDAKQEDAILHAMNWYEEQGTQFDYVCLLEPTTPLRKVETLNRGFEELQSQGNAEGIFSVTECEFSPVYCSTLRPDGLMKGWMDETYKWAQRQEVPVFYALNPLVVISEWESFRREESFLHDKTKWMIVDGIEGKDIDEPFDWFVIEQLMANGLRDSATLDAQVKRAA